MTDIDVAAMRKEWHDVQSSSPSHRRQVLEWIALEARCSNPSRETLWRGLPAEEQAQIKATLAAHPKPVLQFLMGISQDFTAEDRVTVLRCCLSRMYDDSEPMPKELFQGAEWNDAKQCSAILHKIDYWTDSPLDFGRVASNFSSSYNPSMGVEYRKMVVKRLCTSPGRCPDTMLEGLIELEPQLDDEMWQVVETHNELKGDLPDSASERMKQLMGQRWIRSRDMTEALRAVKKYRIDPLRVSQANPDLTAALQVLKELWSVQS